LPNLTCEERTSIAKRLAELMEQDDEARFLNEASIQMFLDMDRREGMEPEVKMADRLLLVACQEIDRREQHS